MAIIDGTAGGDSLNGTGGDDTIFGLGGDDVLNGGGGANRLEGGAGDDRYIVASLLDEVVETAGQGYDAVWTTLASYTLGDHVEQLVFTGTGTAGFHGIGNGLDNWIEGGAGSDVLDGKGGGDTMAGYGGDDHYHVDSVDDYVMEQAGGGTDRVYTSLTLYTLGADVEQVFYTGTADFQGNGNSLANFLQGGSGNDFLSGGIGADTMYGNGGDDGYEVDNAGDMIGESFGGGYDTAYVSLASYTLAYGVEKLVYTGAAKAEFWGNDLDNRIEGGAGDDRLNGGTGQDVLVGKGGHDRYVVDHEGDVIVEEAFAGWDRVDTSLTSYVLGDHLEELRFDAYVASSFFGVGNSLDNSIYGGAGNDTLDGKAGADIMVGNGGDDSFYVDHHWDHTGEFAGEGFDTVYAAHGLATWTLEWNVEKLVYMGWNAFHAIGNADANVLVTGAGKDTLNGGAGADTMSGGAGDDLYIVDHADDIVVEWSGAVQGYDTVQTGLAVYTLAANVEKLVYAPQIVTHFTATGNDGANLIIASAGNDHLNGGAGADTLHGKGGNDLYLVDDIGDVVVEDFGAGIDEVRTSAGSRTDFSKMYVLPAHVENLTGAAAGAQGVYANAHDNVVSMGDGGDLIVMHDGGTDAVTAGGGNDFIYYGNALTAADYNDGGAGYDTLGLLGSCTITLGAGSLVNIEKLAVYGSGGGNVPSNHYNLATNDANVAAGQNLMVVGSSLGGNETLFFNGQAETDGHFNIRGGQGADTLTGGAKADQIYGGLGADLLRGGDGKDSFEYSGTAESSAAGRDQILDFAAGDKINLWAIDADGNAANGNSKFAFIGTNAFTNVAGQLRVSSLNGTWHVEGDTNGDGLADLSIFVTTQNGYVPTVADFVL